MNAFSIALVWGYLPEIDHLNSHAAQLQLLNRLAIVMPSFYPGKTEMYFDSALFLTIVKVLLDVIPHQEIKIYLDKNQQKVLASLEELKQHYAGLSEENQSPFHSAKLIGSQNIPAYWECIDYTAIGGSAPYHDSFTLAVYTKTAIPQQKISERCNQNNISIDGIYQGKSAPQISLLTRVQKYF
jgi:hypothetical protein